MKKHRLIQDYLQDILDAMDKAAAFIGSMDFQAFSEDDKTLFAVIRSLEIIGEAAKKIPVPLRRRYGSIPWKNLTGMRDKLIHDYVGVSVDVVWQTVKNDIPSVRQELARVLACVRTEEDTRP
ncbi:DUF86 domain-containing protein [Desulfococcus sp.]|uniref:HepT-like ribonuclease domain-containing protein n=1 Tax=Desulfococcus sp. TaxID=2025834 RepID=UPI0035934C5D